MLHCGVKYSPSVISRLSTDIMKMPFCKANETNSVAKTQAEPTSLSLFNPYQYLANRKNFLTAIIKSDR